MDNIQKLVFGVLSVAGLLAMATPSDLTVTQPSAAVAVAPVIATAPVLAEGEEFAAEDENFETESVDDDPFAMSEPSIDGNPIGQPVDPSQSNAVNQQPNYADQGQYSTPNYNMPQPTPFNTAPPATAMPQAFDDASQAAGQ